MKLIEKRRFWVLSRHTRIGVVYLAKDSNCRITDSIVKSMKFKSHPEAEAHARLNFKENAHEFVCEEIVVRRFRTRKKKISN